jgi:hypothetical protein
LLRQVEDAARLVIELRKATASGSGTGKFRLGLAESVVGEAQEDQSKDRG